MHPGNFHRDDSSSDGWRSTCRQCRKDSVKDHEFDERIAQLEIEALDDLEVTLQRMGKAGSPIPHVAELYQRIIEVFGGPVGFAKQVAATYFSAKPGSTVRQKLLDQIMRTGYKVSEMGMINRDLEHMSTEDLKRQLESRLNQAVLRYNEPDGIEDQREAG